MHVTLCDGLPGRYALSNPPGDDPQPACTTQSPKSSGDYPNPEGFYSPAPSLGLTETVQPTHHRPSHVPDAINTASQTYSLPYSAGTAPTGWPTPPATTCDDFEDYTYHGSPTSGSFGVPGYPAAQSPMDSPRSWPSPEAQHLTYPQPVWKNQEPVFPYHMHIAISLPGENPQQQHILSSPFANTAFPIDNMDPDSKNTEAPAMTPDHIDSAMSDRSLSPQPRNEVHKAYTFRGDDASPAPVQGGSTPDGEDASRVDTPYNQLIYRAFMSREDHAMTLQELYQWMRDNTDRASAEDKGWQNSIRHNLSMNGAFVKRVKLPGAGSPTPDSGQTRRSTEWVLEDWAVAEGVQSTTRYRRNNPRGRGSSGSQRSTNTHRVSARATSGRKGGITTSKTRAAAQRRQQYGEMLANHNPAGNYQRGHPVYTQHSYMDFTPPVGGEPMTPPDVPAGPILFSNALHGPQPVESGAGNGYFLNPLQPESRHLHYPQSHFGPGPSAYRLEDVTSVYQPLPASPAAGPNDPSELAEHLPAAFSRLFTDDMRGNAAAAHSHVNGMNYSWAEGGPYHA